jgi:signal transduction histidine kinase
MIIATLAFLSHWALAAFILVRHGTQQGETRLLIGYLGGSAIWTLSVGLSAAQLTFSPLRWRAVAVYTGLGVIIALLLLARALFHRRPGVPRWLLVGATWLGAAILLDPDVLPLIQFSTWRVGGQSLTQRDLADGVLALSWGFFALALLAFSWREYRRARSPLHRNRMRYLLLAVTLTVAGDGLFALDASPYTQIAPLVKLGGTISIVYAAITRRLPDIKQIYRRSIGYVILSLITGGLFMLGVWLPSTMFRTTLSLGTTSTAILVAVVLALGYLPLRRTVQSLVDQFLFGKSYEYERVLSDYSQRIADILDLRRLTGVVIDVIDEVLAIERGALLVAEGGDDGISKVRLKPYTGLGLIPDETLEFRGSSPVLIHLRLKGLPLTRQVLNFEPDFEKARPEEIEWLCALRMEVLVPIRAKERLIGVLAVGAKQSGDPYFSDDLDLLSALADETAVALENARLFEDLTMLNTILSRAYAELDRANRQLQEMDRLKSAFIGVVTHELLTPFANVDFALQLLARYARKNLSQEPREQIQELGRGIEAAKTMVENLVTFAAFFSKQGELSLAWLDFGKLVQEILTPLASLAEAKEVAFQVVVPEDLPPVRGDQERLGDAIYHLTQNAVKFTPSGGQVRARCWATAKAVYFEVKDTGVGVPAEKLPTLWEDFTQMADPLRRGKEGLGLGLALVKYIIVAHGGEVKSESQEGIGSTFGFQVPLKGPKPHSRQTG